MPDRAVGADDLGQSGFDVFTDTTSHTPSSAFTHWIAIRPLEGDITPTAITGTNSTLSGIELTKDVVYQGVFTTVELAAGKIQCYRSNE